MKRINNYINKIKKIAKKFSDLCEEEVEETDETEESEEQDESGSTLGVLQNLLNGSKEPDLRVIGLFGSVEENKISELVHGLLILNEMNREAEEEEEKKPIDFFVCTYGGSADDMFALYDIMQVVKEDTEIHTFGVGKVMSAGVLILAAGTKGKRKIGRNCRVMIHGVAGGSSGILPNILNELTEMEKTQEQYIDCLVSNSKLTKKKLKKLLNEKVNIYLTAEEAVEYGIADIIV